MDEIRLIDSAPDTKTVLVNGVPIGDRRPTGDAMRDIALIHDLMRKRGIHKEISKAVGIMQHAVSFSTTARLLYDRGLAGDKPHDIFAAVTFAVTARSLLSSTSRRSEKSTELAMNFAGAAIAS